MASKAQSRTSKSGKSGGSGGNSSAKSDGKGGKSKKANVPVEDEDGDDKDAMAYKVLSQDHTNLLMPMSVVDVQEKLKEIFNLANSVVDLKEAAILDYYTSGIWWAIQQKFTAQQVSGFFSLLHVLLENVKDKNMPMVENVLEMKKLLVGIGMEGVKSAGLDFFNIQQARLISDYAFSSFFQHYSLYSFMFSHTQAEEIIGTDLEIEVAKDASVPFPPPLDEGVTEEMYEQYIATPPPTPSPVLEEKRPKGSRSVTPKSAKSRKVNSRVSWGDRTPTPKSPSSRKGSGKTKKAPDEAKQDMAKELEVTAANSDLFATLTPQDVREVVESITKEMLGGLQSDVAAKLRDKENLIISRINKIHKVAES